MRRRVESALGAVDPARARSHGRNGSNGTSTRTDALAESGWARLKYLRKQIPLAVQESLEGLRRITAIVDAMNGLAMPPTGRREPVDLAELVETAADSARRTWADCADVATDFDAHLPAVPCFRLELLRALDQLVENAAHAVVDRHGGDGCRGRTRLVTRRVRCGTTFLVRLPLDPAA